MWYDSIVEFWNTYYPMVLSIGGTVIAIVGTVWGFYSTIVKPLKDKIDTLKSETETVTTSPLEIIQASSLATDLKAKLDNPTISDTLKLEYQEQLFALEKIIDGTNTVLDSAIDTTKNF